MAGRSFADVLDDALGAVAEPVVDRWPTQGYARQPADPFLFFSLPDFTHARAPFRHGPAPFVRDAISMLGAPEPVEMRRPARALTIADRHALDALNALGARLSPDFTAEELRREYRRLAHRVHPDRHHDRSEAERQRLSRQFGEATDHYRRLLALVDLRH